LSVSAVYCGQPKQIANGFLDPEGNTGVVFGKKLLYKCFDGYAFNGTGDISCLDTGEWSPSPTCQRKKPTITLIYMIRTTKTINKLMIN
jgi:hypothetical protein